VCGVRKAAVLACYAVALLLATAGSSATPPLHLPFASGQIDFKVVP